MTSAVSGIYTYQGLGSLLGAPSDTEADLVLPKFDGASKLAGNSQFIYPGGVYSDRDTKSALHVSNLLTKYVSLNNIFIKDTNEFDLNISPSKLVFAFGSKSNTVTQRVIDSYGSQNIFSLTFGDEWSIHSNKSNKYYSIKNPATLDRAEYENVTDFGIIARYLHVPGSERTTFVIAGLGSRATEGCGIFFANNWELINTKFADKKIAAVILMFNPPVTPQNSVVAEWLV